MKFQSRLVEPGACWIKWWLTPFPRASGFFLDLGDLSLRFTPETGPAHIPAPAVDPVWIESSADRLDETVWLPLSRDDLQADLLAALRERQVSRVVEVDSSWPVESVAENRMIYLQEVLIYSPIDTLIAGDLTEAVSGPDGAVVVFPWIPGFTSSPARWRLFLQACADSRVREVLIVQPSIEDGAKRELARRCADDFQYSQLFHVSDDANRDFSALRRAATEMGLALVSERPQGGVLSKVRRNRRIAGALLVAADFGLESHGPAKSQEFYRAASLLEKEQRDLQAIAAEGNLKVVEWLSESARDLVLRVVEQGDEFRLAALAKDYCSRTPI